MFRGITNGLGQGFQSRFPRLAKIHKNRKLRKTIRLARGIMILTTGGAAAYAAGEISVAKDPKAYEKKMLMQTLLSRDVATFVAVNSDDNLGDAERTLFQALTGERAPRVPVASVIENGRVTAYQVSTDQPLWKSARHCVRVFSRIQASAHHIAAARVAYHRRKNNLPCRHGFQHIDSTIPWERLGIDDADYSLEHWEHVERMLASKWKIIVIGSLEPNAFVHPGLPKRVFVTAGLLELFCKNDDQLAAILGHELSHCILGHGTDKLGMEMLQQVALMIILSLLDFTGFFSFFFEAGLFATNVGKWVPSMYSRMLEREADTLGSYIAARACYDPSGMADAFENMMELGLGQQQTDMLSTHPATEERVANAVDRVDTLLAGLYRECESSGSCPSRQKWDTMLSEEKRRILVTNIQKNLQPKLK